MIVVFVRKTKPVMVFETTKEKLVLMVSDTSATGSYVASLPPGSAAAGFEAAWARLTRDMISATHFDSVEQALQYFKNPITGLSSGQHACILSALRRIAAPGHGC